MGIEGNRLSDFDNTRTQAIVDIDQNNKLIAVCGNCIFGGQKVYIGEEDFEISEIKIGDEIISF